MTVVVYTADRLAGWEILIGSLLTGGTSLPLLLLTLSQKTQLPKF